MTRDNLKLFIQTHADVVLDYLEGNVDFDKYLETHFTQKRKDDLLIAKASIEAELAELNKEK